MTVKLRPCFYRKKHIFSVFSSARQLSQCAGGLQSQEALQFILQVHRLLPGLLVPHCHGGAQVGDELTAFLKLSQASLVLLAGVVRETWVKCWGEGGKWRGGKMKKKKKECIYE